MTWPTTSPLTRELDEFWKESQSLQQQWWYEADLDTKMLTGQQDYWNTFYNINYRNQKQLMFNKILRVYNMIAGFQIDNRLATVIIPADSDPDDGQTQDDLTAIFSWITRQDYTYETISKGFGRALTCGLNLIHVYMDFRRDPENGEIITTSLPFSSFLMDPYWEQPDLSDCNRIWTRKYLTKKQLLGIFPSIKKDLPLLGDGYNSKDGKFPFLPQAWYQYNQQMYAYDEYWVKDSKKIRKILDASTGEIAEWGGNREQFQLLRSINPNVELISARVPTIKKTVLINGYEMFSEKQPYGLDCLPFVPVLGYHFPEVQNYAYRYFGIVRNIRDSQVEVNRRRNRLLDVLDAQTQSGVIVKEDALVNPEDAFLQGPGRVLFIKNSADINSDIKHIDAPPVAAGWMELINSFEKEILEIVGPEELFGQNMGHKDASGAFLKLKMGAGTLGLRNLFENLNVSQSLLSKMIVQLVLNNFSSGHVQKILGRQPSAKILECTTPNKQLKGLSKDLIRFNCAVEEGELTATQRQLQFMQATALLQVGVPVPMDYLIDKSTLQGKKDLKAAIAKQSQTQQQLQMAQAQSELQQQQMLAESLEAKAAADRASAVERNARAFADISLGKHHTALATQDLAKASLDNAKTMKELESIDESRLMKMISHLLEIQERQSALNQAQTGSALEHAEKIAELNSGNQQYDRPPSAP